MEEKQPKKKKTTNIDENVLNTSAYDSQNNTSA